MKRKNSAIRLIRKRARGFRVGECLFLFDCVDPFNGFTYRGSYQIREIKHLTESTVTFICDGTGLHSSTTWACIEFQRDQEVHRIAGEPLGYIIREDEFT
jgi:hypothetical protein